MKFKRIRDISWFLNVFWNSGSDWLKGFEAPLYFKGFFCPGTSLLQKSYLAGFDGADV